MPFLLLRCLEGRVGLRAHWLSRSGRVIALSCCPGSWISLSDLAYYHENERTRRASVTCTTFIWLTRARRAWIFAKCACFISQCVIAIRICDKHVSRGLQKGIREEYIYDGNRILHRVSFLRCCGRTIFAGLNVFLPVLTLVSRPCT